jgi:hypothetical protein
MESLLELFYDVDDFCQAFFPNWNRQRLSSGVRQRYRTQSLTMSEIMFNWKFLTMLFLPPVPADDIDPGVVMQPRCHRFRFAIRQEINDLVLF